MISGDSDRVELEIAGEKVVVEGWPAGRAVPLAGETSVNGERVTVTSVDRSAGASTERREPPAPSTAIAAPHPPTVAMAPDGPGASITPPIPGKVVEVRVKDGDAVTAGQVVLVLEAMKMRNEVAAPITGTVADLRVTVGANVRAREPMLRIVPA